MVIKLFNIKEDKSKRLWIVILTALTVASMLLAITVYKVMGENSNIENLSNIDNIFSTLNYECKYHVSVLSNKTLNKYNFKEIYEKRDEENEYFCFITKNELGEEIKYIIDEKSLKITSSSQINEYILSNYVVSKKNLLSISTFINLYNNLKVNYQENSENKSYKIEIEEIENIISYKIIFLNFDNELLGEYKEFENLSKMELLLSKESRLPLQYIVYDKDGNAFIEVEYTFFSIK